MKPLLVASALSLALAAVGYGQPNSFYINNQVINSPPDDPPQGYATNYVNQNSITVTEGFPFYFYDVVNYTNSNQGIMSADIGFLFNNTPDNNGIAGPSGSFYNAGTIKGGVGTVPGLSMPDTAPPAIYPLTVIWASNVVNKGLIDVSVAGNLFLTGDQVDLSRGTINIQGFDNSVSPSTGPPYGMFDDYWGGGTLANGLGLANVSFPSPSTPNGLTVTNAPGTSGSGSLSFQNPTVYLRTNVIASSNQVYQLIYLRNRGPAHAQMDAAFVAPQTQSDLDDAAVRWIVKTTNYFGKVLTDTFYLEDTLPTSGSVTIASNQITQGGQFLYAPNNFTMSQSFNGNFIASTNTNYDATILTSTISFPTNTPTRDAATSLYGAWGLDLLPVTFQPDTSDPSQTYTNIPGRVEINANNLNLTRTILSGPNYVNLTVTNFVGSPNAQMEFPVSDLTLGATNGTLVISNLIVPYLARPTGAIDMWSTTWSNVWNSNDVSTNMLNGSNVVSTNVIQITNRYSVLMVDSILSNTSGVYQEHVSLNATNVLVSDQLTIASNLFTTAQNFTLTSNTLPMLPSQLDFLSTAIVWSPSFPNLQDFTNWGLVSVGNTAFFSHRASPNFPSPGDSPYQQFVNHGTITSVGANLFWSDYFENSGAGLSNASIRSFSGDLTVQAATALLANDHMTATNGDMALDVGNLTVSNTYLQADGEMFLTVTNQLNDTGAQGNVWLFGDGIYMTVKPATGDLLGTSITVSSPTNADVDIIWPGVDMGATVGGFANNAAVGSLALFGASRSSAFHFGAAGAQNAIYIDQLVLEGSATDASAFDIDPNMKIYFSKAMRNGTDISGSLANGTTLVQVPGFAGPFVATRTRTAFSVPLTINFSGPPQNQTIISWQAVASADNILYSTTNPSSSSSWTPVTNIVVGPDSYLISLPVTTSATNSTYYELGIQPVVN